MRRSPRSSAGCAAGAGWCRPSGCPAWSCSPPVSTPVWRATATRSPACSAARVADPRGRVALVTGASSGIGAATARAFAGAGLRVALCTRRKDRLEQLAAELTTQGAEATVHAVAARWGRLDVLVNNAGRGFAATLEQTTAEELRALMELNVVAVLGATQAALPIMRRQGSGHIINVSSVVGRRAVPYRAAYSATKFALGALSEALRVELTGTGIAVTLVYPI